MTPSLEHGFRGHSETVSLAFPPATLVSLLLCLCRPSPSAVPLLQLLSFPSDRSRPSQVCTPAQTLLQDLRIQLSSTSSQRPNWRLDFSAEPSMPVAFPMSVSDDSSLPAVEPKILPAVLDSSPSPRPRSQSVCWPAKPVGRNLGNPSRARPLLTPSASTTVV